MSDKKKRGRERHRTHLCGYFLRRRWWNAQEHERITKGAWETMGREGSGVLERCSGEAVEKVLRAVAYDLQEVKRVGKITEFLSN